ncbi:BQ2448_181 [Microbotryum intermedium]|uniref:BQ2448_181 protein n=1 Tax=Microbotryum intermedium TaxID=269621 RepID=A0A238F1R4_9BASI|nr:BQ2448_181 [Microbotryum intermedium]
MHTVLANSCAAAPTSVLISWCRAHNVHGYSKTKPLPEEWFLHALTWSCELNCNACSNEYVFKRRQAANHVAAVREYNAVSSHLDSRLRLVTSC